jgi:hypothetical protein
VREGEVEASAVDDGFSDIAEEGPGAAAAPSTACDSTLSIFHVRKIKSKKN